MERLDPSWQQQL